MSQVHWSFILQTFRKIWNNWSEFSLYLHPIQHTVSVIVFTGYSLYAHTLFFQEKKSASRRKTIFFLWLINKSITRHHIINKFLNKWIKTIMSLLIVFAPFICISISAWVWGHLWSKLPESKWFENVKILFFKWKYTPRDTKWVINY